jgi:hypothetical protein
MSLDKTSIVDAIGIENKTGAAVLTIADSWDWNEVHEHLIALQSKLNAYLEFIESGQIWDDYPAARGRQLVIDVVSRFPPPKAATDFMEKAGLVAGQLNVVLRQTTYPGALQTETE